MATTSSSHHPPLTAWRFRWSTTPVKRVEQLAGNLPDTITATADRHAAGFRSARVEFGLTLREVSQAWGVSAVEIGELERGQRRFLSPADFYAAMQQLFCWASERYHYAALSSSSSMAVREE